VDRAEMLNMTVATQISEQAYRELALNEPDRYWELWDGALVEKPQMSMRHNAVAAYLGAALIGQLDRGEYRVTINGDRARISSRSHYIPDVMVIPAAYQERLEDDPWALGTYADPLPLVVEVWSPSTGRYDLTGKLEAYRARGDLEVWLIHPVDGTLTAWRKQPDGNYAEAVFRGGIVPVASLPGVAIDPNALVHG
jgi:Uma2 family endonuclease